MLALLPFQRRYLKHSILETLTINSAECILDTYSAMLSQCESSTLFPIICLILRLKNLQQAINGILDGVHPTRVYPHGLARSRRERRSLGVGPLGPYSPLLIVAYLPEGVYSIFLGACSRSLVVCWNGLMAIRFLLLCLLLTVSIEMALSIIPRISG